MKYLIAVALAVLAVAGCSSSASHPAAGHTSAVSAPNPTTAPSSAAPSPSPASTARLTKSQARRAYTEIVDPSNRANNAVGQDYTDRVPLAQYRRDLRAYVAATLTMAAKLGALRWPARVEPYLRAMLSTDVQASIRCARDEMRAHSYGQVDAINSNQDCTEAQNTTNADTIRSLLGLPSLG
jgi:hypothetical protein